MEENPDRSIQVEDHDNGGVLRILERKEVTQVHRTIGYNLNLVESNADAVNMLVTKAKVRQSCQGGGLQTIVSGIWRERLAGRAQALQALDDSGGAADALRAAVAGDSQWREAHNELARLLNAEGNAALAKSAVEAAYERCVFPARAKACWRLVSPPRAPPWFRARVSEHAG